MIIAVNTRLRKEDQPEGYEDFMFETLDRLTGKFPDHQFIYIFDRQWGKNLFFAKNVTPVIAGPETKNSLRLQYWFNYKVPVVLRRYKADVFVSMDGICSLRTKKPQCLLLSNLGFIHHPQSIKRPLTGFYKKFTPAFIARSKSIATVSAFSRSVIAEQYHLSAADVKVIKPGIDEIFKPVDWEEKEMIKEKYSEGKAYFLFSGNINQHSNLLNLLKAFSFFKKRQKSNMLLLIAGKADEPFKKELKTYKFRSEVMLLENLSNEELAKITAAAYAMVYPVLYTDFALPALQALGSGVPLITTNAGAIRSICGNAALYASPENFKDIAESMMLVFKDEQKAKELVMAGKELASQYHWDKTADLLMQSILEAYNN